MVAMGSIAFRKDLTPYTIIQSAEQVESYEPEIAEELRSLARDLAAIRNLPETTGHGFGGSTNPWKNFS